MILIHVTTIPETFGIFRGQIAYMKEKGFEVHAISSPGPRLQEVCQYEKIKVHGIKMSRTITPYNDIIALFKLYRLFKKIKPTIVHSHTPKGGFLGVVAARLSRVPIIIYGLHGFRFVTMRGIRRQLLILTELVACRMAHLVIAVSYATKKAAVANRFCNETKIRVLASGTCNGIDAELRFNPQELPAGLSEETRNRLRIPKSSLVVGYVGRIVRDKGIHELEGAWKLLKEKFPNLRLLLVGPVESQDPISKEVLGRLENDNRVHFTGGVDDPIPYYAAMDVLTLPSLREGFPTTPLEAAAMQLPVVATTADGCVEAVADGITGILVPPGDSQALLCAIDRLLLNPEMRKEMGKAGRDRVLHQFKPQIIWQDLYQEYQRQLSIHGAMQIS